MTRLSNGDIILSAVDRSRVEALLDELAQHVIDIEHLTSMNASEFVKEWQETARASHDS